MSSTSVSDSAPGAPPLNTAPLPAADELLRSVLELSLTAIQWWRPVYGAGGALEDFALDYLNPAGQRMLGLGERPGGTLRSRFPNAWPAGVFAFYRRVFETDEPGRFEVNYQADGLDNYYRVAARRCGPVLVVSFTDTADHERSAVELALRESQARERLALADALRQRQRLLSVFELAPALIARLTGPDHVVELANAALRRAFAGRVLVGRACRDAVPELAAGPFLAALDEVWRTGTPYEGTALPARLGEAGAADGPAPLRYFDLVCQPSPDADGTTAGVFVFGYDVTEQVQARRALQGLNEDLEAQVQERTRAVLATQATALAAAHRQVQEREAFYRVFEQSPTLIVLLREPGHRIEYCNPAFQQLFPGRELLGRTVAEILPELHALGVINRLDEAFGQARAVVDHELRLPARPDQGPEEDYYTFTYQAYQEGGQTAGVTLWGTRVTEQVRARQRQAASEQQARALADELAASNQQLVRTNADLDAFTYTASHDLSTPLTNLQSLLHALREELPLPVQQEAEVGQLLGHMQGSLDRFQRTLTDLTDVIREQSQPALPAETVDLAALLDDVRLDLAPLLAQAEPQLRVNVSGCPRLWFAPRHLRSILYNLLSNALKYRDPARPPVVDVVCHSNSEAAVLEVHDNGLGLTEEQLGRLFGLFQRLHPHIPGTGVGLYSIKKIVENAGGTIVVTSALGVGTCFTVRLPRWAVAPAAEAS